MDRINDFVRESVMEERDQQARSQEVGQELMILKFPGFLYSDKDIDSMIEKARMHKALILDLRGNPGGSVDTLKYLVGGIFEREIKIGDRVGRQEHKPLIAKPRKNRFAGTLIVLVDSQSASASEILARLVQIEKRASIVGDLTSGSVMEAKLYSYNYGSGLNTYGISITDADIIMTDGKSLEHVGVTPDRVVLPNQDDLANGWDPVLSRAAESVGVRLSPEAAGKMFPYEWPIM